VARAVQRFRSLAEAIEVSDIPAAMGISDSAHDRFRADLLHQAGRDQDAARILLRLAEATPEPGLLDMLFRSLFLLCRFAEIEKLCDTWIRVQPEFSRASQWMLSTLFAMGRLRMMHRVPVALEPARTTPDSHIPRMIFQYWDAGTPPDEIVGLMNTWAERNPDFDHVVFDRVAAQRFLARHFPAGVLEAFDNSRHPPSRNYCR
jgi:hypothetical protein